LLGAEAALLFRRKPAPQRHHCAPLLIGYGAQLWVAAQGDDKLILWLHARVVLSQPVIPKSGHQRSL
jgi:hypothetical protein